MTLIGREPRPLGGQAAGLVEAEGEVHALDGGAGGALGEVVDRADGDQAAGALVDGDLEVDGVRAEHRLGLRPLARGQEVHERLVGVRLEVRRPRVVGGHARLERGRAGGQDAAGHRDEDRGEATR